MVSLTKNAFLLFLILGLSLFVITTSKADAQMMGGAYQNQQITQQDIASEQEEQDAGQKIFQELQQKKVTCQTLSDDNFDKLGDYFMGQRLGSTEQHAAMDKQMTQMMGEERNTYMHIILGKRASGCFPNTQIPSNTPSFLNTVMGNESSNQNDNDRGVNSMMWGYSASAIGWGFLRILTWTVGLIDLILLGIWLFKRTKK